MMGLIDVDLHHEISDWPSIATYAPDGLRWRFQRPGGPPMARSGYRMVGPQFGSAPRPDSSGATATAAPDPERAALAGRRAAQHPASDPGWVREHYIERYGIERAILTGSLLSLGVQPYPDLSAAVARAVNDWTLATWVRPYSCFKGSIVIAQQDPLQAAAEIDRLGDDPGMVQVLMGSASESPFGRRVYHPIYAACVRHDLPLALHIGGEGTGIGQASTGVGHPTTYYEWYASLPQTYMGHLVSLVCEGVFELFPTLKVVLYEGGIGWLPHLLWRFDKNWKGQRGDTPWVKRPPSEYLREHVYLTTYPLEAMREPAQLDQLLEMVQADRTLLFAGNFPHWEFGDPFSLLDVIPAGMRPRVASDNARAVYGERLLASHR